LGGVSGLGGAGGGGRGGVSGTGGAGGSGASCAPGAPAAAAGGASFPFPQHRLSGQCIYPPTCSDAPVAAGWQMYKARFIVDGGGAVAGDTLRVQRPDNANDTVSEGIGYGMLFAVYLNDQTTFDKLWKYEGAHVNTPNGLMNWHINSNGTTASGGTNSATDADEDMAFALVMADKQWGGYTTVAKALLAKILMFDFGTDGTIKGGDHFVAVNPSYLAPAYYKIFSTYTGDAGWDAALAKTYDILAAAANANTGLVPDWVSGRTGPDYTYDATRTPFRVALDACWFGDARALAFSQKIAAFFAKIGAANIKDGYQQDGSASANGLYTNATFIGPAGVAAMAGNQPTLLSDAYVYTAGVTSAGTDNYYNLSWAMFSTMMMTGNFVDLSSL
jgi:endo-1,4-beta-D-glucanase Y